MENLELVLTKIVKLELILIKNSKIRITLKKDKKVRFSTDLNPMFSLFSLYLFEALQLLCPWFSN